MGFFKDGIRIKLERVAEQHNRDHRALLTRWRSDIQRYVTLADEADAKGREVDRLFNDYPGGAAVCTTECNLQGAAFDELPPNRKALIERIMVLGTERGAALEEMTGLCNREGGYEELMKDLETLKQKESDALVAMNKYAVDKATKQKELDHADYKAWKAQYVAILNSLK